MAKSPRFRLLDWSLGCSGEVLSQAVDLRPHWPLGSSRKPENVAGTAQFQLLNSDYVVADAAIELRGLASPVYAGGAVVGVIDNFFERSRIVTVRVFIKLLKKNQLESDQWHGYLVDHSRPSWWRYAGRSSNDAQFYGCNLRQQIFNS